MEIKDFTKEQIMTFLGKIVRELIDRESTVFHPNKMKRISREVFREVLAKESTKGLTLVSPHAQMLISGNKAAVVKSKKFDLRGFYHIVSGKKDYGLARFQDYEKISRKEFDELRDVHKITDDERIAFWPNVKEFYLWKVREVIPFDRPKDIKQKKEVQAFVDDIHYLNFERKFDIKEVTPEYLDSLSNKELVILHSELHDIFWENYPKISEPLIHAHAFVVDEMRDRRNMEHRIIDLLDKISMKYELYGQKRKYKLQGVLDLFKDFYIGKELVCLAGSMAVSGHGNDVDLICRRDLLPEEEFRLMSQLPTDLMEDIHLVSDSRLFTSYIPLYNIKFERCEDKLVGLSKDGWNFQRIKSEEVSSQAEKSKREDKIEYFRYFLPLKGIAGYRKQEVYSIKNILNFLKGKFKPEDYEFIIDKKADGARAIISKKGDRVKIQSEDGGDWTHRLPTIVAQAKKVKQDFIVDSEIEGWSEGFLKGKHMGRSDVAGYAHSKGAVDDKPFFANIFTILMIDDRDLHKETEMERKHVLDKAIKPLNLSKLQVMEWRLCKNEGQVEKAWEHFGGIKNSEGMMVKQSEGTYPLGGMSTKWVKGKKEADLDVEVIDIHQVAGPKAGKLAAWNYLTVVRKGDKLIPSGRTYNTRIKCKVGDILRVAFSNINKYTDPKTNEIWLNMWAARPIEKREDKTKPDSLEFALKLVKETGGEIAEKPFPKRYKEVFEKKKLFFEEEAELAGEEAISGRLSYHSSFYELSFKEEINLEKEPPKVPEVESKFKKWTGKTREQILKMDPKTLPKGFFQLSDHFRGRSLHSDLRIKINDHLEGWTIANQIKGAIKEDVDTFEKAEKYANDPKIKKMRPDMPVGTRLYATEKGTQPLVWIKEIKNIVEPGQVGATATKKGVFWGEDWGLSWPGTRKAYFREYFLRGSKYKGRFITRLIGRRKEWERVGKKELFWFFSKTKNEIPYLMSPEGRKKRDYVPPRGTSGLSPEFEAIIPDEIKWWTKAVSKNEALKKMDLAFNWLIDEGYLKHRKIEVKELELAKAKFILQKIWWLGAKVVRAMPVEQYSTRIDRGKEWLDTFKLKESPLFEEAVAAKKVKTTIGPPNAPVKAWMTFKGKLPPAHGENPNKKIEANVDIEDSGSLNILEDNPNFMSAEFKGKHLKGLYTFKRETPKADIWVFQRLAGPGGERD